MKRAKATHSGTCQGCAAVQKLPGGVLAKHGYVIPQGYFHGTCRGSGLPPYEHNRAFILDCIDEAKGHIEGLRKTIAELQLPAATPEAWVRDYNHLIGRSTWTRATIERRDNSFCYTPLGQTH